MKALPTSTKLVAGSCLLFSCRWSRTAWQKAFPAAGGQHRGSGGVGGQEHQAPFLWGHGVGAHWVPTWMRHNLQARPDPMRPQPPHINDPNAPPQPTAPISTQPQCAPSASNPPVSMTPMRPPSLQPPISTRPQCAPPAPNPPVSMTPMRPPSPLPPYQHDPKPTRPPTPT